MTTYLYLIDNVWRIYRDERPIAGTFTIWLIRTPDNEYIAPDGEVIRWDLTPEWARSTLAARLGCAAWELEPVPLPPPFTVNVSA